MSYMDLYNEWLENDIVAESDKAELRAITDEKEIEDRFYKELDFGTGGLRGVLGMGTNRMNVYTVGKATQGLANYINKKNGAEKGVAIAYDSRRMSPEFASKAANCLNANGIKTYIFPCLTPTPELSFALRELGAIAGIVITASHNPPEYNGYKVYWEDGAQITPPIDGDIIAEVRNVKDLAEIKSIDINEAKVKGLYNVIGFDIDDKYTNALLGNCIEPEVIRSVADKIKIVYTPFNGTGNIPVRRVLSELGFENVYVVKEQENPDPDFTTLDYPNPEDPKAFTYALKLAKEKDADIILATDPDADRLGIYAKDAKTGEYVPFTGNMSAILIADYLLSRRQERGLLHSRNAEITKADGKLGALVTTIVSTNMGRALAKDFDIDYIETLTGFKYIGEQIKFFEESGDRFYEFGFEESYGCLVGTHARDKDAPSAVMSLCEVAAYEYSKGRTLVDRIHELYEKYGYYREGQHSITMKGADGAKRINDIMETLRSNPPKEIAGFKALEIRDYSTGVITDVATGNTHPTGLPKSNVFYLELENDAWVCSRPSGTEPKIKLYIGVRGTSVEDSKKLLNMLMESIINLVK